MKKMEKKNLLIKAKRGGHWDFPKGHQEENETFEQTALREIKEETGLTVKLFKKQTSITYINHLDNEKKTVTFFLCQASTNNVTIQKEEVEDYAWLTYGQAIEKLTYDNAKEVLKNLLQYRASVWVVI